MRARLGLGFFAVVALLVAMTACPIANSTMPDGGDGDGGDDGPIINPPLRDVTFGNLPPGDFAGGTLDAVTFQVGPYGGSQVLQIQNQLGEGQDLILECGQILLRAPELHRKLTVVFNDDVATILVAVLDQNGQMFNTRPYDTHADAGAPFITRVDPVYKKLEVMVADGSSLFIGSVGIASCQGYLHEIVLQ